MSCRQRHPQSVPYLLQDAQLSTGSLKLPRLTTVDEPSHQLGHLLTYYTVMCFDSNGMPNGAPSAFRTVETNDNF